MAPSSLVRASLCFMTSMAVLPESSTLLQRTKLAAKRVQESTLASSAVGTGQASNELKLIESLAVSAIKHGAKIDEDTKKELRSLLGTELKNAEDQINDAHAADIQEGEDLVASYLTNCNTPFVTSQNTFASATNTETGSVGLARKANTVCRETLEDEDGVRNEACNALDAFLASMRKQGSTALKVPDSRAEMADWWVTIKAYAANYPEWKVKDKACRDAEEQALVTRVKECNTKQGTFETTTCAVRQAGQTGCTTYGSCREQAEADVAAGNVDGAAGEASRKVEWEAIQKIKCFVNLLLKFVEEDKANDNDSNLAELNKCKTDPISTTHLDLTPAVLPAAGVCDLSGLNAYGGYPCTTSFLDTNYKGLFKIDYATCIPCDAAVELPPPIVIDPAALKAAGGTSPSPTVAPGGGDILPNLPPPATLPTDEDVANALNNIDSPPALGGDVGSDDGSAPPALGGDVGGDDGSAPPALGGDVGGDDGSAPPATGGDLPPPPPALP